MEVESAMLASSLNPAPTLSASATARFPASSTPNRRPGSLHGRRVCDSPISVEGVSSSPDRRPGSLHARDSLLSMEGESAMLTWIGYPAPALSMEGVSPIAASSLANRVRHGNTGEAVGSLVDAHHGETNGGKGKGYIFHPGRMWRGSSNSVTLVSALDLWSSVVFLLGFRCFGGGLDHWKLNLEKSPFSLSPLPSLDMLRIRLLVALQLSLMLCLCLIVAVRIW
ncbi:hypothetical protein ZEAMMB73_Zm00001d049053 [Zea mays]|uniref:Uncharacterized protein n=2 Tax=Zea mays TaxID=4577 RepID=K7TVF4_MAIZE|nr:hypothetical protein ZEAMMB73_Zm00001d049053 [Zea mays]AQK49486.1 hypothetical protein ZEAMMB73_Zm00001d049053 [Zea mays]AQK49487.1 hypothetical protein ZEAMMB73_Zm00001d049053 [Zea mays]AQK49490.1 hypothetical protein ZEAMMB73_Zm00001d049053 [Zea mays]AQK49491.1 hypothetical protein ZEAMMB73_Zm00001d049053 [Zea mays]